MNKFKKGDRVRIKRINEWNSFTGTVTNPNWEGVYVQIKVDEKFNLRYKIALLPEELELLEETSPAAPEGYQTTPSGFKTNPKNWKPGNWLC